MKSKLFYKISIVIMLLFIATSFSKCKNTEANDKITKPIQSTPQEQRDWEELNKYKTLFYKDSIEKQKFQNGTFWYKRKFEDKIMKNRLSLTRKFLKNYPESEHYFDVLKYYFTYLPEPRFIDFSIPEDKKEILNQKIKLTKEVYNVNQTYLQFRTLPYNSKVIDQWIAEGDSLVNDFINSSASEDEKARIEIGRLSRDLRTAISYYQLLSTNKPREEADFWFLFDRYFWRDMINQLDQLIFKYPNYPQWPTSVNQFITILTGDHLSPELRKYYWNHYKNIGNNSNILNETPIIKEIRKKAVANLKAINELELFDENLPLQMEFTSMDGQKIDLKDYRGKVVLIDFWSIRCGPCIQEMPHIRALYDKYKKQGFEVIGISSEGDADRQRVLNIAKKQGANWPQLLDGSSDVTVSYHSLYKIHALPTTWLLDKNGVIADRHARGSRLEPLIKKHLESD